MPSEEQNILDMFVKLHRYTHCILMSNTETELSSDYRRSLGDTFFQRAIWTFKNLIGPSGLY